MTTADQSRHGAPLEIGRRYSLYVFNESLSAVEPIVTIGGTVIGKNLTVGNTNTIFSVAPGDTRVIEFVAHGLLVDVGTSDAGVYWDIQIIK